MDYRELNDEDATPGLNDPTSPEAQDDTTIITEIKTKFKECQNDWAKIRAASLGDYNFAKGEDDSRPAARARSARSQSPTATQNQVPNLVQQVENDLRQLNPSCNVHPTDAKGSDKVCTILQGIIRHIERISDAEQAYLNAAGKSGALVLGFGFTKLNTRMTPGTFKSEIFIEEVKDPFTIMPDFSAKKSDFDDAEYWFEFDTITKDAFKRQYPDSKLCSLSWTTMRDGWISKNDIRLCTYWYKTYKTRELLQFETGDIGYADEYGLDSQIDPVLNPPIKEVPLVTLTREDQLNYIAQNLQQGIDVSNDLLPTHRHAKIINVSIEQTPIVHWILTNGAEILDRGDWPTEDFPFTAFVGTDTIVNGQRDIHGIVRYARDSQKVINYLYSQIVRKMAASNRSPWMADINSVPGKMKTMLETSNIEDWASLFYDSTGGGTSVPGTFSAPARTDAQQPVIDSLLQAMTLSQQGLKETIGVSQAIGMAVPKPGMSGVAVQSLAQAGKEQNFHFSDNFVRGIKSQTRKLLALIPKVYTDAQVIRIVGPDDKPELIQINQMFSKNGRDEMYDIANAGIYDLDIDVGPTFATMKAEQNALLMQLAETDKTGQMMLLVLDLITKNMDGDLSQVLTDRVAQYQAIKMPWLNTAQDLDDIPPEVKGQLATLNAQLKEAQQHVVTLQQAYSEEKQKNEIDEIQTKGKIEVEQIKATTAITVAKLNLEMSIRDNNTEIQNNKDDMELKIAELSLKHINEKQHIVLKGHEVMHKIEQSKSHVQENNNQSQDNIPDLPQPNVNNSQTEE